MCDERGLCYTWYHGQRNDFQVGGTASSDAKTHSRCHGDPGTGKTVDKWAIIESQIWKWLKTEIDKFRLRHWHSKVHVWMRGLFIACLISATPVNLSTRNFNTRTGGGRIYYAPHLFFALSKAAARSTAKFGVHTHKSIIHFVCKWLSPRAKDQFKVSSKSDVHSGTGFKLGVRAVGTVLVQMFSSFQGKALE